MVPPAGRPAFSASSSSRKVFKTPSAIASAVAGSSPRDVRAGLVALHTKSGEKIEAVEIREVIYQCAPFIGFPKTLNAIAAMNETFTANGIALPLENQETITEETRHPAGLAIQAPTYGSEIRDRYAWLPGAFKNAVPDFLTDFGFGDFSTRTGLGEKDRELLTVVLLAALGGAEVQVRAHVAGALKTGSTREEVVCALVHAMPYMGIPRLFNALNCAKDLLSEEE